MSEDETNPLDELKPWGDAPSVLERVIDWIENGDPHQPEAIMGGPLGAVLDDDDEAGDVSWAAGAKDGVATHHMPHADDEVGARRVMDSFVAFVEDPNTVTAEALYEVVAPLNALTYVDLIVEDIVNNDAVPPGAVYVIGNWLATSAPDWESVKVGIALLGLFEEPEIVDLLNTLGRHDELTLFAAVALSRIAPDPEQYLYHLGMEVHGWGRVHIVERLAETDRDDVSRWMLTHGFRNDVMNEYLALTAVESGRLSERLAAMTPDNLDGELLASVPALFEALVNGGPAGDLEDYADGAAAAARYLELTGDDAAPEFKAAMKSWLGMERDWESFEGAGWTAEARAELLAACS